MFFRKTLLPNILRCFCERLTVKRARFLRLLNVLFSFVGEQTQTPTQPLLSPEDVIISQLQAISQLFSSYPPLRSILSSQQINYSDRTRRSVRNVYLVKIGPNTVGDAHQDICKDKECNLGPVASCLLLGLKSGRYMSIKVDHRKRSR